jgi:hypothetical protein
MFVKLGSLTLARLVLVEYKSSRLKGTLALALGIVMVGLVFTKALMQAPLWVKIVAGFLGGVTALAGFWNVVYGPRLASAIKRLSELVAIEENKLLLPGPLRLRRGSLRINREWEASSRRSSPRTRIYTMFEESDEKEVLLDSLDPESFKGLAGVIAGPLCISTGLIEGVRAVAKEGAKALLLTTDIVEWLKLPAYKVIDEKYRVPGASIIIALLPRMKHEISLSRDRLVVSKDREAASAELRVSNGAVEGILSYIKPLEGRSKAAKLELEVFRRGIRYRFTIARINKPGSLEFRWRPDVEEDVYILITDQITISPRNLLKKIGIEIPLITGVAWEEVSEAKLRLVLEIPMAKDVVDEAEIRVQSRT